MAKAVCVAPDLVHLIWPKVSHFIKSAYLSNQSDETFEDTEREVLAHCALLWIAARGAAPEAAAVSKIWATRREKICSVLAVGGSADDWPALLIPIEQYAQQQKCHAVRIEGRQGWARVFREYRQPWIILEKRFDNAG